MKSSIIDVPRKHTQEDLFGIQAYQDALIEYVELTDTPITIALQGEWGSGKTSSLYLLFDNPVCGWLNLGYNVGAEWDGTLPSPTAFAALCLGFSAIDSLGCFVESYNYFGSLGNVYAMDFSLNWQVNRKVQLDIAANIDLGNPAQSWAISCGVAWQMNR